MLKLLNGSQAFSIQPAGHAFTNHHHRTRPNQDAAQSSHVVSAQNSLDDGASLLPVSTSSFVVGHQQRAGDTPTHKQTTDGKAQLDEHLLHHQSENGDPATNAESEDPILDDLDSLLR